MNGDNSQQGVNSYLAVFREATWGTFPAAAGTNATAIEFLSCSFQTEIKTEKLNALGFRGLTKRVQLDKSVAGSFETYLHPEETTLLLGVALGGAISSASLTGAFIHSITAGDIIGGSIASVAFSHKKGDAVFNYTGGRVDTMKISANVGEVAKVSFDMIFKDATIGATNIASSLTYSEVLPFTFVNGVFRLGASEAAADTTTAEEPIQGFELTVKNNLKTDASARKLGSNVLSVLPPTRREVEFKIKQRFDTTTTYDRFINNTAASVELKFTGATITADKNYSIEIRLPKVYARSGDPTVGGADEILQSEISYDVLMNTATSAGREIGITVINNVASYTSL